MKWNLNEIEALASKLPSSVPDSVEELPEELVLFEDDRLRVVYAPLGSLNTDAKIIVVGLTPGWQQTRIAYDVAIDAIAAGATPLEAHKMKKSSVAFAGSMRTNLIAMLDEIGVADGFGLPSSKELFGSPLLHTTSALRFPVFRGDNNYTGHGPRPTKHAALLAMIDDVLGPELVSIPRALIVPLGNAVDEAIEHLAANQVVDRVRCLVGFPHPSGANGHRKRQFSERRQSLGDQVSAWFAGRPAA